MYINDIHLQKINQISEQIVELQRKKQEVWIEFVLFSPHWWIQIGLTILPWLAWFMLRRKESQNRMLFVAFFAILIASILDFIGVRLGLWRYYFEPIPFLPAFIPWDMTLVPVIIISLIAYKRHIKPWIKALVFAALTAFVAEPIFEYFHFYQEIHWSSFYSFFIYIIIYLLCHKLSTLKHFDPLPTKEK